MAKKKNNLKKKVNSKATKKRKLNTKSNQKNFSKKRNNNVNKTKITKNVGIEHKNIEKAPEIKGKDVNKDIKGNKLNIKNRIKNFLKYVNRTKKIWGLTIVATIIILVVVANLKNTTKKIFLTFKSYSIGEHVTLKDDSTWYVIESSSSGENLVKLLSANVIDLNNDGKITDKDKLAFDSTNSCNYDTKNDKNIGYFLENKFVDTLGKLNGIKEVRLLNSEEYILVRKTMDFGYDWEEGNWLAGDSLDSWWLETSKYNKIYVVTERGSYRLANASSKNYVRPVIIIDKENIK